MRLRFSVFAASLLFILLFSPALRAQQFAAVTGVVTDKSGAVIEGVDVSLDNDQTDLHVKTQTNAEGIYQFVRLAPGPGYKLSFGKEGFKKLDLAGIYLEVSTTSTRNAILEVGLAAQTVEVNAAVGETLNTTDASVGGVLNSRDLQNLPSIFREDPSTLLGLQAGVTPNQGGGTNRAGAVTGARTDETNVTIDGIDANDQAGNFSFTTVGNAPIESLEEFRVTTANGLATDGRSSGGQIALVTKSGTNDFHGSAYEFNRTAATAANDFFNNSAGVPTPALTRNQFGASLGGPVKKNKLFFFFNYEGRRDASKSAQSRTVPEPQVLAGGVNYVNNGNDAQGNPCTSTARLNDPVTAQCITSLSAAQVAALDPHQHAGANAPLLSLLNKGYNNFSGGALDPTGGDGINTELFRFNAPDAVDHNTYVGRVDYRINSKQSLFGRFNVVRESDTQDAQQFPGEPTAQLFQDHTYSFVIGHTWNINSQSVNNITAGVTRQFNDFPAGSGAFPTFPNEFTFGPFSGPFFNNFNIQSRTVPTPTFREDFSITHGKHTFQIGADVRPIRQKSFLENDFNFIGIGLGGNLASLGLDGSPLRPANFLALGGDPTLRNEYDGVFSFLLGRFASQQTNFNYTQSLQPQPPGTGKSRDFHYDEVELYAMDSWRARSDLTITYGLRWSYYGVPFESNGFETVPNVSLNTLFATRVANGLAGIAGPNAAPLLTYDLGGSANNAPNYYRSDKNNYGPRLGISWNPSFKEGLMGHVFGDRKTTLRLGGSIFYDRVAGTVSFLADQNSFLFQNSAAQLFGQADPVASLMTDPRFTNSSTPPVAVAPPVVTRPVTPFVANGVPFGVNNDQFLYAVDPNFKTPYEEVFSIGVQRELPGNALLEVDYVGRLGRRLFAESDGAQLVDFKDPASSQGLIAAFNNIATAVRTGAPIPTQPFFENQVALAAGAPCTVIFGGNSCSFVLANSSLASFFVNGDITDFVVALNNFGLLRQNIGLAAQAASIAYVTSNSASDYNGLLVILHKRFSKGLQLDFDYTFSHSIDNTSSVVNVVDTGFVCDLRNLRVCRGNSDFDATHIVSSNFVYQFPFGHDGYIAKNVPGWLDRVIGGWSTSGIVTYHTGFALGTVTGSFPVGNFFGDVNGVPAVFNGNSATVGSQIHNENGLLQFFANPTATLGAFSNPLGGQIGNRNDLRGPGFATVDLRVSKNFKITERTNLQFISEAFNLFNHENFVDPNTNINSPSFGALTATRGEGARQMQFALRFSF